MADIEKLKIGNDSYSIRDASAAHALSDVAAAGDDITFTEDNTTAFTEVGTGLTITDGIASGFTTLNYIQADESPFYNATGTITSFEAVVNFTTTNTTPGVRGMLYQEADNNTATVVQIYWYYSSGSGTYKVGATVVPASGSPVSFESSATLSTSGDNWLKFTWSSTETAKMYYSTDGVTYNQIGAAGSVVSALRAPNNKFTLGYIYNYGSPSAATDCFINLNKSYTKVNGVNWTPYVPMKMVIGRRLAIQGSGAPTTSTAGSVGQFYVDTTNETGYMCVAAPGGTYTWKQITA